MGDANQNQTTTPSTAAPTTAPAATEQTLAGKAGALVDNAGKKAGEVLNDAKTGAENAANAVAEKVPEDFKQKMSNNTGLLVGFAVALFAAFSEMGPLLSFFAAAVSLVAGAVYDGEKGVFGISFSPSQTPSMAQGQGAGTPLKTAGENIDKSNEQFVKLDLNAPFNPQPTCGAIPLKPCESKSR